MASTITQALAQAQRSGLARIDATMLLLHALGHALHDRAWLIAHGDEALPAATAATFDALCQRRLAGEPVAYLVGSKEFHGLRLAIDARVLDPRPDTETLVDWALELLAERPAPRIIDLGTGSGAIALALAHARPDAQVLAIDASADALAVARANAQRLRLPVQFAHSLWLQDVPPGRFDAVVSNPPYIAEDDPHLPALRHEPRMALASGADGLDDIRAIVAQAPAHLAPGGWLLLEHGWDQAEAVQALLRAAGFAQVHSRHDLAGIARCSGGTMAGEDAASMN
ncbi:peptide chain release factor N(5)-glutamine methyltransferase [Melaminivora jejuensis]|uniref:peptide chain release factor N(5)-glutamine methyltransferase n=1 Tax=Melaminivora jejuensis TaxID=1267217 RepID=UPI001AE0148C|nr:peptide chain release factor N(5)-glutamine methyltransferase [Melaminivora jejuensis]UHJ64282.1 peptide chain release factor N(5)-glutamine methyltransferase [Melaminivora jejuensis]